jgi:hypothetical protein
MKKYAYIFWMALTTGLIATSCSKSFLQVNPETTLNGSTFFQTEPEINQAVIGAYSPLLTLGRVSYWLFGEVRSDNTTIQYNTADRSPFIREYVDQFIGQSTSTVISDFWLASYQGISRCNDVLAHIDDKTITMSDSSRNQYKGEAEFLRGYYYFTLVRQFGGVPLRLSVIDAPSDVKSSGRASVDDVYRQILADVTDAAVKLPASYAAASKGRITSGAANTLLGEVYMTNKRFADALTALRKVTGYGLMANYQDIFDPAKKNNMESIFEINYLGSQATLASNFLYIFAPLNSGTVVDGDPAVSISPAVSTSGMNIPTKDMINAYEGGDLRKDISLATGYVKGGNFIAEPYVKKYNWGFGPSGQTNVDVMVYRYADVLLMIAECVNEQGALDNEAFTLLNQIRTRAGLPAKSQGNADPALSVDTQNEMRDAIAKERRVELAFENHRWYDLVRTGKAVSVMNAHGIDQKSQFSTIPSTAYNVTVNNLLLLIPQTEIDLDKLTQNPQ